LGAPPAEAYALTKEQLHRPVHDAIARGAEDARRVVASWSSEQTRTSIARFLASLRR
jgi:enoyl-CoA hydratase